MDAQTCKSCKYFMQHYYLDAEYAAALNCGHCIYRSIKHCKPHAAACKHYEVNTKTSLLPDRDRVIRFLTTDFLKEMLERKLPPEMRKDEGFDLHFLPGGEKT